MSLYDRGSATGFLGGMRQAEDAALNREEKQVDIRSKQAEFFDYMDAAEERSVARQTAIAEDRARQEILPSETELTIGTNEAGTELLPSATSAQKSSNELARQTAEANKTLVDPKRRQALQQIHTQMSDQQFDDVTRAYKTVQEGMAAGRDPAELYDMARRAIISAGSDPQATQAWLNENGIGDNFDKNAFNALTALSTFGLHDAATTRQEHLLDVEWAARVQVARQNASGKPTDTRIKRATTDEKMALGNTLSTYVPAFDGLQGTLDTEAKMWTGDKGAAVEAVSSVGKVATVKQILGDPNITDVEVEWIAADMMNFMANDITKDGILWGFRSGGDDFDSAKYIHSATTGLALLETMRTLPQSEGQPIMAVWRKYQNAIMQQIKNAQVEAQATGNIPSDQSQQKQPVSTPTVTSPQEDLSGTPTESLDSGAITAKINEVNKQIRALSESEKYTKRKGRSGKTKTEAFKNLLNKKSSLSAQRRKQSYRDANAQFEGAL